MSHCIHAIVASDSTSDAISQSWPELPRLRHKSGFSIFPVDDEILDARIAPDTTPTDTDDGFMLLTTAFLRCLRELSSLGMLAYVETEYFGGVGGQGALVFHNGVELMAPTWSDSGTINSALKTIGVPRGLLADRFTAIGFSAIRDNDDLIGSIAAHGPQNGG